MCQFLEGGNPANVGKANGARILPQSKGLQSSCLNFTLALRILMDEKIVTFYMALAVLFWKMFWMEVVVCKFVSCWGDYFPTSSLTYVFFLMLWRCMILVIYCWNQDDFLLRIFYFFLIHRFCRKSSFVHGIQSLWDLLVQKRWLHFAL